jgi:phosphohistidine phosphatase
MYIYLIQHGEAKPENIDPDRSLTDKGVEDVIKTSNFMKNAGVKIDEIWHSTKLRAKQTAEIVAKAFSSTAIEIEGLKPNDPAAPFVEKIRKIDKDIAIVGHLPFLQKLASLLLTGSESNEVVLFKQGGLVCLQKSDSSWCVACMITPDLII